MRGSVATAWRIFQSRHRTTKTGNRSSAPTPKNPPIMVTIRRLGGSHTSSPEERRDSVGWKIHVISQSVYGSFFEYSDLKQNQKNQITELFFFIFLFGFETEKGQKE